MSFVCSQLCWRKWPRGLFKGTMSQWVLSHILHNMPTSSSLFTRNVVPLYSLATCLDAENIESMNKSLSLWAIKNLFQSEREGEKQKEWGRGRREVFLRGRETLGLILVPESSAMSLYMHLLCEQHLASLLCLITGCTETKDVRTR